MNQRITKKESKIFIEIKNAEKLKNRENIKKRLLKNKRNYLKNIKR